MSHTGDRFIYFAVHAVSWVSAQSQSDCCWYVIGHAMANLLVMHWSCIVVVGTWRKALAGHSGWFFKPSLHPISCRVTELAALHAGHNLCLGQLAAAADAAAAAGNWLASAAPAVFLLSFYIICAICNLLPLKTLHSTHWSRLASLAGCFWTRFCPCSACTCVSPEGKTLMLVGQMLEPCKHAMLLVKQVCTMAHELQNHHIRHATICDMQTSQCPGLIGTVVAVLAQFLLTCYHWALVDGLCILLGLVGHPDTMLHRVHLLLAAWVLPLTPEPR